MNEQAVNEVISNYAIENANLKLMVATLSVKLEQLESAQVEVINDQDTKEEEA